MQENVNCTECGRELATIKTDQTGRYLKIPARPVTIEEGIPEEDMWQIEITDNTFPAKVICNYCGSQMMINTGPSVKQI